MVEMREKIRAVAEQKLTNSSRLKLALLVASGLDP